MFQPFRSRTAVCLILPILFLGAGAPVPAAEGDAEIEEILVTGSYIKGTPEDAPLPVTALTRSDLALEGSPTTLDLIKNLSFSQGLTARPTSFRPAPAPTGPRSTSAASGRAVRWCSSTGAAPLGRPMPSAPKPNCWWT